MSAQGVMPAKMNSGVWILDPNDGAVLAVAPAYARLFGADPARLEIDPLAWLERVDPKDRERVKASYLSFAAKGVYHEEFHTLAGIRVIDRSFPIPLSNPPRIMRITERASEHADYVSANTASFDLLFSANPHPSWIFDHVTLQFLAVNHAAIAHYGYSREEFLAMTVADIRPLEDIGRFLEGRAHTPAGFSPFGIWRHKKKDGSEIQVQILSHGLLWRDRQARLVLALDVTERQRTHQALQYREARYRRIVETAQEGIWLGDVHSRTVFINERGATMLGYAAEQVLDLRADELFSPAHDITTLTERLGQEPDTAERFECAVKRRDGKEIWLRVSSAGIFDEQNQFQGVVSMFVDITERRTLEKELQEKAAELLRSNLDLEQFAYVISHDLQEPLRTIAGYLQLIQQRYGDDLDDDGQDFIEFAVRGAGRMSTMIKDLLAYSRIGRVNIARVDRYPLAEAVERATSNLDFAIQDNGATIAVEPLPQLRVSPPLLLQLFQNLIGNALKYRGEAAPLVEISAEGAGPEWIISIADNGIGIEPAHLGRIFGVFTRLHGSDVPGTGIGLAICKRIVQFHGGRIWAESTPGAGSRFRFTLPAE